MLTEPTLTKLNAMKLSSMAESWQEQQKDPGIADLSFDERLGLLVDAEYIARENRKLTRRLREAKLRLPHACVEDVQCTASRGLPKAELHQLRTCLWIEEHLTEQLPFAMDDTTPWDFRAALRTPRHRIRLRPKPDQLEGDLLFCGDLGSTR